MSGEKLMPFAYFRKRVVPVQEATVSLACHSLQYGTTCFGGIRGYVRDGKTSIFRLKDHYERLMDASKILGFGYHIPYSEFEEIVHSLVEANAPESDFYIRPILFSDAEGIGVCHDKLPFHMGIYMIPLGNYFAKSGGLRLMVSSWQKIPDGAISTKAKAGGAYINSSLATSEARRCGYDEALLMDQNQHIAEASAANLFIVYRGEVYTPPVGSDVLEGITWRTAIELLQEAGYTVRYEPISRSMLYTCDELLLTGTAAQVIYAESVDGRVVSEEAGPVCRLLQKKFAEVLSGEHPKSAEWLTEVTPAESRDFPYISAPF